MAKADPHMVPRPDPGAAGLPRLADAGRGGLLVSLVAVGLVQAALAAGAAMATRAVFSELTAGAGMPLRAMAVLGICGAAIALLQVGARWLGEAVGQSYIRDLRLALYRSASREDPRLTAIRRPGAVALRFIGDLSAIRGWIGGGVPRLLVAIVVLPAMACVLVVISPELLPVALAFPLAALGSLLLAGIGMAPLHRRLRRARAKMAADLAERLRQAASLDLIGRTPRELDLIRAHSAKIMGLSCERSARAALLRAAPEMLAALAGVACIYICVQAGLPTATLAAALATLGLTLAPLRDLATLRNRRAAFLVARRTCLAALNRPARETARGPDAAKRPATSPDPNAPALELSAGFRADAGARIAIDGPGAAPLAAALAGIERPPPRRILLSGLDLAALSNGERRAHVQVVTPRGPILRGSLRRVLSLGLPARPNDSELLETLHAFGLAGLAGEGLAARIAEDGLSLSAEDRLRLQLARGALARVPLLMIEGAARFAAPDTRPALDCLLAGTGAAVLLFDGPADALPAGMTRWHLPGDGVALSVHRTEEEDDG